MPIAYATMPRCRASTKQADAAVRQGAQTKPALSMQVTTATYYVNPSH
jgi:hypothetical protein